MRPTETRARRNLCGVFVSYLFACVKVMCEKITKISPREEEGEEVERSGKDAERTNERTNERT